jgi:hypothetical protein
MTVTDVSVIRPHNGPFIIHFRIMCVLCFNSQWRSVVIGLSSAVMSLLILLVSVGYR